MKTVSCDRVPELVTQKPVVIVDKPASVPTTSRPLSSPSSCIKTNGGIRLPTELWLIIIELAVQSPRSHAYVLARPRCVENSGDGPRFVCDEIQKRDLCGDITDSHTLYVYERDLQSPDGSGLHDNDDPFTFKEPNAEDSGATIKIPTATIDSDITVLYEQITVPDVISRVEYGLCCICVGQRIMCAGCNDGRRATQNFISWRVPGDCGAHMFCPLCIGVEYAEESLWQNGSHYGKYEDNEVMSDEDYNKWRIKRLREVGY